MSIIVAPWQAWPGFEAFFVTSPIGPCYLIQVGRADLARRLRRGEALEHIVTEREPS
jgi:hypothetical protein